MIWLRLGTVVVLVALGAAACRGSEPTEGIGSGEEEARVRYVALGDSYTIGTSVSEGERWPNQLAERLSQLDLVANLGVNGYTSADLIADELPMLEGLRPELVTVLIGVNDVVRSVTDAAYAENVAAILDSVMELVDPDRIVCVATPDYTRTPRGADFGDPEQQSLGIERVNRAMREACEERGIVFVPDTFEISQRATSDLGLVAEDGLHPSGEQYRLWVDAIEPVVERMLGDS